MEDDLLKILLCHAEYSFACVNWKFDQLTDEEQRLVQNQANLDRLRKLTNKKLGKPLIEIFDEDENDKYPLFV